MERNPDGPRAGPPGFIPIFERRFAKPVAVLTASVVLAVLKNRSGLDELEAYVPRTVDRWLTGLMREAEFGGMCLAFLAVIAGVAAFFVSLSVSVLFVFDSQDARARGGRHDADLLLLSSAGAVGWAATVPYFFGAYDMLWSTYPFSTWTFVRSWLELGLSTADIAGIIGAYLILNRRIVVRAVTGARPPDPTV